MDMQRYLEIPYVWDGRSFEGADCYGLLVLYFREELGIELWDPLSLRLPHWREVDGANVLDRSTMKDWVKIAEEEARVHDAVLIKLAEAKHPNHCGVIVTPYEFLHIQELPGVHVSKLKLWRPRITGYYRHRSLIHG